MNKLLELGDYQSVVSLFEQQLPFFTIENSNPKSFENKQLIPNEQASILLEALLLINPKESFEKLKEILTIFKEKNFKLGNVLIAKSFLLAINQVRKAFIYQKYF